MIKSKKHNFDYWGIIKPSNNCIERLSGCPNQEKIKWQIISTNEKLEQMNNYRKKALHTSWRQFY